MKFRILYIYVFSFLLKNMGMGQVFKNPINENKGQNEINHILLILSKNEKLDTMIEWKLLGENDSSIVFGYEKSWSVFFNFKKNYENKIMTKINFYHHNYKKKIFESDSISSIEFSKNSKFRVLMSRNRLRTYFCLINPDYVMVWTLFNGNTVYASRFPLPGN